MGCDYGGSLDYTPTSKGADLAFKACELIDGMPLTGTGSIDTDSRGRHDGPSPSPTARCATGRPARAPTG